MKRLSGFFIKKFIVFSIVLVLGFSVFYNLMILFDQSGAKYLSILSAEELILPNFEMTDTTLLENLDGWIEILDEENNVIFSKGKIGEVKTHYTQAELLEQASFNPAHSKRQFTIAGFITISSVEEVETQRYIATYHTFTGADQLTYTGIVKIPADRLNTSYTIVNATGELGMLVFQNVIFLILGTIGILGVCIFYYSRSIEKHLARPNKALVDGLVAVTHGDYETKLEFEAEYEYKQIQSSFNYLTQVLKEAQQQRTRYEQEREQLFSNIAHDLKTPMTSILGFTQSLRDNLIRDEQKQKDYLDTIYNKAAHVSELIHRLTIYSKLNNSQYELTCQKVDFTEFVRQIIVSQLDEFEKYEDELDIEIPETPILTLIDVVEMERVILNLIQNALKHNPRQTTIEISMTQTEEQVMLRIADHGTPIPSSLQPHLFEPFICGDESRNSKQGSGLGLSICEQIIHKHKGTMTFVQVSETYKYFELVLAKMD